MTGWVGSNKQAFSAGSFRTRAQVKADQMVRHVRHARKRKLTERIR